MRRSMLLQCPRYRIVESVIVNITNKFEINLIEVMAHDLNSILYMDQSLDVDT